MGLPKECPGEECNSNAILLVKIQTLLMEVQIFGIDMKKKNGRKVAERGTYVESKESVHSPPCGFQVHQRPLLKIRDTPLSTP
jgi:hypothetical protein